MIHNVARIFTSGALGMYGIYDSTGCPFLRWLHQPVSKHGGSFRINPRDKNGELLEENENRSHPLFAQCLGQRSFFSEAVVYSVVVAELYFGE